MADPLSLAAGSFAVIGVADVVLRASREICRFLSEIQDAPVEVQRLRYCIQEVTLLVHTSKQYLEELRSHTSAAPASTTNSSRALDLFTSAVRALHRELGPLIVLVKKQNGLRRSWSTVKWILDQRKLDRALQKVESSKSTLNSALILVGSEVSAHSQGTIENAVNHASSKLTSEMSVHRQNLVSLKTIQERILAQQDKSASNSVRQESEIRQVQTQLLNSHQIFQAEHNKTRKQIVEGNSEVLNTLVSKLDDLPRLVGKTPAATQSSREIFFFGGDRRMMLSPLLLLQEQMHDALLRIISHHVEQISPEDIYWLQSEFENLVSSATQEVAALSQNSTATSFDQWDYHHRGKKRSKNDILSGIPASRSDCKVGRKPTTARKRLSPRPTAKRNRLYSGFRSFSFSSPVGQLSVFIPRRSDSPGRHTLNQVGFSFTPCANISAISITARFRRYIDHWSEPRIYAQLNVFHFTKNWELYVDLFSDGTAEAIDDAFRCGKISPYDLDDDGSVMCITMAARFRRLDLLRYLDSQGVGLSMLAEGLGPLRLFWAAVLDMDTKHADLEKFYKVLHYLDENLSLYVSSPCVPLLDALTWSPVHPCPEEQSQLMRTWMEFLKAEGYDFDSKYGEFGETALLDHLSRPGYRCLEAVRLLLGYGVDVQETNVFGQGPIECAMRSGVFYRKEEKPEILEEKLSLLIEAGADIHGRDDGERRSPSWYARHYSYCWTAWRRALRRNGMDIKDVLQAEDSSVLLSPELRVLRSESDTEESEIEESDTEESEAEENDAEPSNTEHRNAEASSSSSSTTTATTLTPSPSPSPYPPLTRPRQKSKIDMLFTELGILF